MLRDFETQIAVIKIISLRIKVVQKKEEKQPTKLEGKSNGNFLGPTTEKFNLKGVGKRNSQVQ